MLISPYLTNLCKDHDLTSDDLMREVSDDHILAIYPHLKQWNLWWKWRQWAKSLGLTLKDIENIDYSIEQQSGQYKELRILHTFRKWKEGGVAATFQLLLEALLTTGCIQLADKVCGKYHGYHIS